MPDDADTRPMQVAGGAPGGGWLLGGRYRVLERVGAGGMAEVFRAHDELLDRDVATKVFRTLLDDPDGSTNGATRRELELQAMARLNHPNLITLYDGSVTGDGPSYLVLEFVDGQDLSSRLKDGPLPEPEVREIGAGIADALAYVHAHGLVHRDVKPANILLDDEHAAAGRVRARLSDFGIVRMVGSPQVTSVDLTIGTAYYIAPEQARGSNVGPEADVYALGLVLLEALTGTRAFDGPMHEALAARLTSSPVIPADLPAPWPALLTAMTAAEPAARPDAAAVAQELRSSVPTGVLAGLGASVSPPVAAEAAAAAAGPAPAPVRRHRRLRPALLIPAAMVMVAAVALGALLLKPEDAGAPAGTEPSTSRTSTPPRHSSSVRHRTSAPVANVDQPSTKAGPTITHKKKHRSASSTSRPAAPSGGKQSSTSAPASSSSAPASSSSPAPSSSAAPQTSSTAAVANAGNGSSSSRPGGG